MATDPKAQNCPACGQAIVPPGASMSRYVNLYICNTCGTREAFDGFFWEDKFNKDKPSQPADYNPWAV